MVSRDISALLVFVHFCLPRLHDQLLHVPGQCSVQWQWPTTTVQGTGIFSILRAGMKPSFSFWWLTYSLPVIPPHLPASPRDLSQSPLQKPRGVSSPFLTGSQEWSAVYMSGSLVWPPYAFLGLAIHSYQMLYQFLFFYLADFNFSWTFE